MTTSRISFTVAASLIVFSALMLSARAFTTISHQCTKNAAPVRTFSTALLAANEHCPSPSSSRRTFLATTTTSAAAGAIFAGGIAPLPSWAAADTNKSALIDDLEVIRRKLEPIPGLLQAGEWDAVRSILKTPPVNYLWNTLGDSKNPLVKLAQVTEEMDLMELKDDISVSLQMCDQYSYDNVFLPFQPGNGKIKIKEPTDMAVKAMAQLDEAIRLARES